MATFDLTTPVALVGQEQNLVDRKRQFRWRIDASDINSGTGLAATETAKFGELPAGFVLENCVVILRTAEGAVSTVDIGDATDPDGLLDGGNLNGTVNANIAKAGTEAYLALAAAPKYFHSGTDLELLCPAAASTIDVAVIDVIVTGYMTVTA